MESVCEDEERDTMRDNSLRQLKMKKERCVNQARAVYLDIKAPSFSFS